MSKTRIITGGLLLLVSILILAACTPGSAPAPTVDTNLIFTAAAQTVQAQLTETAAAAPTATDTPAPPAEPTATFEVPTLAPVGSGSDTTGLLTATPLFTLAPLPGAVTATSAGVPSNIQVQWISNEPADNTQLVAGQSFDIKWTFRNISQSTWNKGYYIQYLLGDKLTEKNIYHFREDGIKPNSTTSVIADGIAPSKAGEYHTWWKVKDSEGNNIGDLDLTIQVGNATKTPDLSDFCMETGYYNDHLDACIEYCDAHSIDNCGTE